MAEGKEEEKMLGASVPENLYWLFKGCASARKESMQEAIMHAARLYIDIDKERTVEDE